MQLQAVLHSAPFEVFRGCFVPRRQPSPLLALRVVALHPYLLNQYWLCRREPQSQGQTRLRHGAGDLISTIRPSFQVTVAQHTDAAGMKHDPIVQINTLDGD
jgi:hypothetical protein